MYVLCTYVPVNCKIYDIMIYTIIIHVYNYVCMYIHMYVLCSYINIHIIKYHNIEIHYRSIIQLQW